MDDTDARTRHATGHGTPDARGRRTRAPAETRERILGAAFAEFYRNGYQGGNLNAIVDAAGITKGALFHHFSGKQQLGYAVVDEVIGPLLAERWIEPLRNTADPLQATKQAFRRYVKADVASGHWLQGCPLNNLAQEMSPLDDGFHTRIDALYETWRSALAKAIGVGKRAGTVRQDVSAKGVAALIVASQMGVWGTGKSSQDERILKQATKAVCDYLDSLRA